MIGDLFWNAATSTPALMIVGVIGASAFVVAHMPAVVERLLPQLVPYAKAALIVQVIAFADLMLCVGYRIADERTELRNARFELSWKQSELEQQRQSAEQAAKLASDNKERADALQSQVDDYVEKLSKTPVAADCAFDDDDIRSLRTLGSAQRSVGHDPKGLRKPRR